MSKKKLLYATSFRLYYAGMTFLFGVVVARLLGRDEFGLFSNYYAWLVLAISVCQAGLPIFTVREVSSARTDQEKKKVAGFVLVAAVVLSAFFGMLCSIFFVINGGLLPLLFWIVFSCITLSSALEAILRGNGYVIRGQAVELLVRPTLNILAVSAFAVIGAALSTNSIFVAIAFASVLCVIVSVILRQKEGRILLPGFNRGFFRSFKKVFSISLFGWVEALSLQAAVIILGSLALYSEAADYRVAAQIALLLVIMNKVFLALQAPRYGSAIRDQDYSLQQHLLSTSALYGLLFSLPLVMIIFLFGNDIIVVLFGKEYIGAGAPLKVLAVGQALVAMMGTLNIFAISLKVERVATVLQAIGLVIGAGITFFLAASFGATGAAIGYISSVLIFKGALALLVFKKTGVMALPFIKGRL